MNSDIEFLDLDDVLATHARQIERYGGANGLRDQALLEAAVAVPASSFKRYTLQKAIFDGKSKKLEK